MSDTTPDRIADTAAADGGKLCAHTVALLRDRAESYWRDSRVLAADGDTPMATAYKAVADELRLCADILEAS